MLIFFNLHDNLIVRLNLPINHPYSPNKKCPRKNRPHGTDLALEIAKHSSAMKNNILILLMTVMAMPGICQTKVLWDGEGNSAGCNKAYGTFISGSDAYGGSGGFRAEPDKFHMPKIGFNCSKAWRADISGFDALRFFIKANQNGQTTSVRFTTYFAQSNWINVDPYVQGGGGVTTDYKEVRIPLSALKKPDYDLSSIEYLEFSTTNASQLYFFIDDIQVIDLTAPNLSFQPVAAQVAKIWVSERFDATGCKNVNQYTLKSSGDPNFQTGIHPIKVGRHHVVTGLAPNSGSPVVDFELYLIFDKPMLNGISYQLLAPDIKDLSGNNASLDTTFTFSDSDIYGNVKANQVGYLPGSPKLGKLGNFLGDAWFMPIDTVNPPEFQIRNGSDQVVFNGLAKFLKSDADFSGESVFDLDFSAFATPGEYHLYVPGYGRSESFVIASNVYDAVAVETARGLFYQRAGDLPAANGGDWKRGGLPATTAEIHPSQSSSPLFSAMDHPVGTPIPMMGGWLDAGDYGRYMPTAASALFILFTAFELYPEKFPDKHYNIPESGNAIPDILDELKYETDWLKQMQAPDGGVYFRVTPATWSSGLPADEHNKLFVSEKTTQSTAVFAAAMAMAARNFKTYFPAYAEECLNRAKKAWQFLQQHPDASPVVNVPGISAGPYPDPIDLDNRAWAAAELYKTTGEAIYKTNFLNLYSQIPHQFHATMSWAHHTFKAAWAHATTTFPADQTHIAECKNKLNTEILVNYNSRTMNVHAYHGAYHPFKGFVGYGTFGMAQSYAFDYILFSYLLGKPELLDYAKIQLDIPLGNNPLSKSFITGAGKNPPKQPLHWSTVPGKFAKPVPGIPVFGPNASLLMNRPSSFAIQDSANRYPYGFKKEDPYPVLRRYTDAREAVEMSEFTIQEIAVTAATFAFFSTAKNTALPVRFAYFNAKPDACNVNLMWSTSEEINADYFIVQRSKDGVHFDDIGRVYATGNSAITQQYSFVDSLPDIKNYYRIKEVDHDNALTFSKIIYAADPCKGIKITISSADQQHYNIKVTSAITSHLVAELIDLKGFCRKKIALNNETTQLATGDLPTGIYIITVKNEDGFPLQTKKILID